MLAELRCDPKVIIKNYRLLTPHVALVTYSKCKDLMASYSFGNFIISSIVTGLGRMSIVQLNKDAEANGYFVAGGMVDTYLQYLKAFHFISNNLQEIRTRALTFRLFSMLLLLQLFVMSTTAWVV